MKLSLLAPLVVAAVVNAIPLRVVVISSSGGSISPALHAGHVGDEASIAKLANYKVHGGPMIQTAPLFSDSVPSVDIAVPHTDGQAMGHEVPHHHHQHHKGAHPCPMKGKFGSKLTSIANSFRGAFGLPLIEVGHKIEGTVHGGIIHITSTKVVGGNGPHRFQPIITMNEHHKHHSHHGGHMGTTFYHGSSFLQRIHVALMNLGPWEGRAVAFVLGCGLGVLLRMLYVLALISYRVIKGRSPSEDEDQSIVGYTHVIYEYQDDDAEEIAVAPPHYTYPVDEKVAPVEETK